MLRVTEERATLDERESGIEALRRWCAARSWARRDPSSLEIAEVLAVGPAQVVLTSICEARGVRYRDLRPFSAEPDAAGHEPDPWSISLEHPPNAPAGHELERALEIRVRAHCGMCSGLGQAICPSCEGRGTVNRGDGEVTCTRCRTTGSVRCSTCRGSGALAGSPVIWSRIEHHERVRVEDSGELPTDVYLALQNARGGRVVHAQEGEHITTLEGGYRGASSMDAALTALVHALRDDPGVPPEQRVLRQRLEVRRVPAWVVRLASGAEVWVYDEPPVVSPRGALDSTALRIAHLAPYAVGLCAIGAAAWLWLR